MSENGESIKFVTDNLRQFHCFELPCFIKNEEKAIESIGGIEGVKALMRNEERFVFRFPDSRPAGPGIQGNVTSKQGFLIKVTRKKCKSTNKVIEESAAVVGIVKSTVSFNHVADYQVILLQFVVNLQEVTNL
jgi:hypothetical protein